MNGIFMIFALILRIMQNEQRDEFRDFVSLRCVIYMNSLASYKIECLIFVSLLASLKILIRLLELENKIKFCRRMFYTII